MIKASEFVPSVVKVYEHGDGYIWGQKGGIWTETLQKKATRAQTVNYGRRWLGYTVWDCSGLVYALLNRLGWKTYHGSNAIWRNCLSEKGLVKDFPPAERAPGMLVFLTTGTDRHHVGVYIGNGLVVEAKGTQTGVTISKFDAWDECGYLKNLDYDLPVDYVPEFCFELNLPDLDTMPTIRKGDSGPNSHWLQALLREKFGFKELTVDNHFGDTTFQAVKEFQTAHGLYVDGVVGPKTWKALYAGDPEELPEEDPVEPDWNTQFTRFLNGIDEARALFERLIDQANRLTELIEHE